MKQNIVLVIHLVHEWNLVIFPEFNELKLVFHEAQPSGIHDFNVQQWQKEFDILFCSITPPNLGQLLKPGTDLEPAGPYVFKKNPTCAI